MVHHMMGALLGHELASLFTARRADDGQAAGTSDLDRRHADAAAGPVNQNGLSRHGPRALEESAIGSAVGDKDPGSLCEAHSLGKRMDLGGGAQRQFGISTAQRPR